MLDHTLIRNVIYFETWTSQKFIYSLIISVGIRGYVYLPKEFVTYRRIEITQRTQRYWRIYIQIALEIWI